MGSDARALRARGGCSLAGGEELLRQTVTTRTHYGLQAANDQPLSGRDVFALEQ